MSSEEIPDSVLFSFSIVAATVTFVLTVSLQHQPRFELIMIPVIAILIFSAFLFAYGYYTTV